MRVAIVIQSYRPVIGGAQRLVERLGPLLADRDCDVRVITRRIRGTGSPSREDQPGLDVRRTWIPSARAGASLAYTALGTGAIARWRPNVVHVHDLLSCGMVGVGARRATSAGVVASVHSEGRGGDVDRLLQKHLAGERVRMMSRAFSAITCLSEASRAETARAGFPGRLLRIVPNGVDATTLRPPSSEERASARAELELPAQGPIALYAGRFAAVKRLEVLIEAMRGAPGTLVLVGDGEREQALRELADDPALGGRVEIRGPTTDPAPFYRAADLYLSASRTEGMSIAVMEAMAAGLAVVAVEASGMRDLLGDGAGIVLDEPGPGAMAAILRRLDADPGLRAALGAAARERALGEFDLRRVADRWVELYAEVAA